MANLNKKEHRMLKGALIVLMLGSCSSVAVGASYKLTTEQAIKLGLENNERIKKAESIVVEADAAVSEAYAAIFPKIDFAASQKRYYEAPIAPIGGVNVRLKKNWETDFALTGSQLIWAFGKVSAAVDLAKNYEDLSGIQVVKEKNGLRRDISILYYASLQTVQ